MSSISTHPNASDGMFSKDGYVLLVAFDSVLKAIEDQVLIPAPDISREQRREIGRELMVMRLHLNQAFAEGGLKKIRGSFHLQRDEVA